jgi:uncharacterized protein YbjT (DUF2867 family)
MILVIGGRGKIGSALLDELAARGEPVRALVRHTENAAALPAGVEPVVGDLADPGSLAAAMAGVEKVFLLCSPTEQEVQLNRNAIDAAGQAGVQLLVRSSILGSDPQAEAVFRRDHGLCDQYLQQSGLPHRIIRPNLFLQNVPENTMPGIDAGGRFYVNAGEARLSMVDTRDVAAVAAALLTGGGDGATAYDVTGPEALSYQDVAAKLSAALGRPISYVDVPDQAVHDALIGFGLGEWMTAALVGLYQDYKRSGTDGYAAQLTTTVQDLTGSPARTLDQLLAATATPTTA